MTPNPFGVHCVIDGRNADLMVAVHSLYPLHGALDATYGEGAFWRKVRPDGLVTNDLHKPADYAHDFRAFPAEWSDRFPAVVFDPPYLVTAPNSGQRRPDAPNVGTGTPHRELYGMALTPRTPRELFGSVLAPGIAECARVAMPRGYVLVKCMDYIRDRDVELVGVDVVNAARAIGLTAVDYFVLRSTPGPQPATTRSRPRVQRHARHSGVSFLYVFRKGRQ